VPTLADPRIVITLTDITARKHTEKQLRSFAAELEERVRQRTEALEQANATILRELAERESLQAQLQHAEKMESIGLLAGGIAHDFNNILNIIKSYTLLLEEHRYNGTDLREICKIFYDAVESGSSTVEQLLTLASRTELDLKPVNLNEVVEHLARLVGRTFQNGIEITLEPGSDIPEAMADQNHISQALLNLCVNARDAMPSGGRLTLRTGVITGQQLRKRHFEAEEGDYVFVQVEDTGQGIDESIRGRIFEPFFTTKGPGKGTGLGLSMVYGIVKNHNGFIDVDSELQRGTKFRIYLPRANEMQNCQ
jgi:signal transduction histidine kinase